MTGDLIRVVERVNDDWLRGAVGTKEGIFPLNFVEIYSGVLPTIATSLGSEGRKSFTGGASVQQKVVFPGFSLVTPTASSKELGTAVATYDYNSQVPEDLVFSAGDIIEIIEWVNDEWFRGRLRGSVGLVPCTYVSQMPAQNRTGDLLWVSFCFFLSTYY